jgi:hypothetical protein
MFPTPRTEAHSVRRGREFAAFQSLHHAATVLFARFGRFARPCCGAPAAFYMWTMSAMNGIDTFNSSICDGTSIQEHLCNA